MSKHDSDKENALSPTREGNAQEQGGNEVGLTDDERVSREQGPEGGGARVEPGPADAERLPK